MNEMIPILSAFLLAATVVGLVLQGWLGARLRGQYPRLWEKWEESSCGFMTLQRFLWLRRYRALGDVKLAGRAALLRGYWVAYFLLWLGVLALFCLNFGSN